jgi:hypothetical protein
MTPFIVPDDVESGRAVLAARVAPVVQRAGVRLSTTLNDYTSKKAFSYKIVSEPRPSSKRQGESGMRGGHPERQVRAPSRLDGVCVGGDYYYWNGYFLCM